MPKNPTSTNKRKNRISVPFSVPIYDLITESADNMGISPASYIAQIVASYLVTQKTVLEGVKEMVEKKLNETKELNREGVEND